MSTPSERLWEALKLKTTRKGEPFEVIGMKGEIDAPLQVQGFPISCREVLDVIESICLYVPNWMTQKFYEELSSYQGEKVCQFIYSKLEDESCVRNVYPPLDILKDLGWKYLYSTLIKTETYHQSQRSVGDKGVTLITLPFFSEALMTRRVYELLYAQFSLMFEITKGRELQVTGMPPCTIETQNVYWRAFFDAASSLDNPPLVKVDEYQRPGERYRYIPEFIFWEDVYESVRRMYPNAVRDYDTSPKFVVTFTSPSNLVYGGIGKFNEIPERPEYSEEVLAANGTSSLTSLSLFKPEFRYYQPREAPLTVVNASGERVKFPLFRSQDYIQYQPLPKHEPGLYDPVNLLEPNKEDNEDFKNLLLFLGKEGIKFNLGDSEKVHRRHLLLKIDDMVKRTLGDKKSVVLPFGSYVLGVDLPGSDMDLLCVIAKDIDLFNAFDSLEEKLRQEESIGTLFLIPEATVPTIKFSIEGVDIDLIFSRLSVAQVPELKYLETDDILQGMEENSIRALNGYRVAQKMMKLVPNLDNWRMSLKFIKLWAKVRGLYGSSFGYMSGVSYALLTAFISQLYPNALPSTLIRKFFLVLHKWTWPRPIQLNALQQVGDVEFELPAPTQPPEAMVWRPNRGSNVMPIITPAFPAMNASYNVNFSTLHLIKAELDRGDILFNQNREDYREVWGELVKRSDFFKRYPYYLELLVIGSDSTTLDLWKGYVESRINKISTSLERTLVEVQGVSPPFPFEFDTSAYYEEHPFSVSYFVGIDYSRQNEVSVSISYVVQEFNQNLKEWKGKTDGMSMRLKLFKRRDLPGYISP